MPQFIISADTILPISSPPLRESALFIVNGKIHDIGQLNQLKKKYPKINKIDLGEGILLPGFINAHVHLELGWIQNRIGNFNGFIAWLEQIIRAKSEDLKREEIESSIQNGIKTLIANGVTTVAEISSYGGIDKPLLKESGLRTILFSELFDRHEDLTEYLSFEKKELFEERPFPHAPYSCSPNLLKKVLSFCNRSNIPFGIHLAESQEEVKFLKGIENGFEKKIFPLIDKENFSRVKADSPYQYLRKLKFFNNTKVTAVHMVQVRPAEVEELKKRDIGVALCPRSNFFLKVGSPPIKQYYKLDRIGIGTDGLSSNMNLDFFEELRFFYHISSKVLRENTPFFTIYVATLGGARSLFLEDKIGSIEKGKDADLIFIRPKNAYSDPYMSVISSSNRELRMSLVKGKPIYSKLRFPRKFL
ncbi:amidohydrolase family protein [Desulfobacterota bacterium AH_259_B03_O07]|nr:amidohydrolase family protein [Desulfobacterota bacterium AH_259_B03_O07]